MSHDDSVDEEVEAILAKVDSVDSTESNNPKKKKLANDTFNEYETNTSESPDSEW